MLPDRVSNTGTLTYESGALPIALRGPEGVKEYRESCRTIYSEIEDYLKILRTVFLKFKRKFSGILGYSDCLSRYLFQKSRPGILSIT